MPPAAQSSQSLQSPPNGTGHASDPSLFEDDPPRLGVCLCLTPVDYPDGTTGDPAFAEHHLDVNDPKSVEQILAWIDDRLHQGLKDAWAGPGGKNEVWNPSPSSAGDDGSAAGAGDSSPPSAPAGSDAASPPDSAPASTDGDDSSPGLLKQAVDAVVGAVKDAVGAAESFVEEALGIESSPDSSDAPASSDGDSDSDDPETPADPEEAWARAVSELLFGMRYGGPGQAYFGDLKWDSYIFSRIQPRTVDYFDIYRARQRATPPATFAEIAAQKILLKKQGKTITDIMIDNDDPAVSLAGACQHIATYGTLTRGFTIEEHLEGCGYASGQNDLKLVFNDAANLGGGRWYKTNVEHLKVSVATGLDMPKGRDPEMVDPPLGPGTIHCYNPFGDAKYATAYVPFSYLAITKDGQYVVRKDKEKEVGDRIFDRTRKYNRPIHGREDEAGQVSTTDPGYSRDPRVDEPDEEGVADVEVQLPAVGQKQGAHCSFVLRVSKDKKRAQLLDTSNNVPAQGLDKLRLVTMMDPTQREGIYDGVFLQAMTQGNKFCGMGVLPPPPVELRKHSRFLRKARPIGVLRLVLTQRVPPAQMIDGHVLYVSQLLRMYGDGESDNYLTSRCAWSLRNTPGFSNIQPWWLIFVPRGELARMMWAHGARTRKLADMEVLVSLIRRLKSQSDPKKKPGAEPPPRGLFHGDDYLHTITLTNDERGGLLYWNRRRSVLNAGKTDDSVDGYPLPNAIRDLVSPKFQSTQNKDVAWNGTRLNDSLYDPDSHDVPIDIPALFRDGAAAATAGDATAELPIDNPDATASAQAEMIDDSDPSGDVEIADGPAGSAFA